MSSKFWLSGTLLAACAAIGITADVAVDPTIAAYQKSEAVRGKITVVGSDTMINLTTLWGESFKAVYPEVTVSVEGKGSATAPPALAEGTSNIGPMSRDMKPEELDKFTSKHGYAPTGVKTAIDALAVFVHKDNPIKNLPLDLVDAIFSSTRKAGWHEDITTWGQLGLTGEWANKPISMYGRNSASGTYGYFKENALAKGDYKSSVKEQPGSAAVVQAISEDLYAIGYSGIGYTTPGVRALPLSKAGAGKIFNPTYENCINGKYPLARYLYIYVNKNPKTGIDPLVREYCKFILSKEGQEIVIKDGYMPLPASIVTKELDKVSK